MENITVHINDDFDLHKIATCGQCFRAKKMDDGAYRFITRDQVIYIRDLSDGDFEVTCNPGTWDTVWHDYFDLNRNYQEIRKSSAGRDEFTDRAMAHGAGIRILRQDLWEMLISFIISQNNNIPKITTSVQRLTQKFGTPITTPREVIHMFPTPAQLAAADLTELGACALGYRLDYIVTATDKVISGALDLDGLAQLSDEDLMTELLKQKGIGAKVANCVSLFGYGRVARAPIDKWIKRIIKEDWGGKNLFPQFGDVAGIVQQYVFFYKRG